MVNLSTLTGYELKLLTFFYLSDGVSVEWFGPSQTY